MKTAKLKKFAQFARRSLLEQVSAKLKLVLAENSAARRERTEAVKKLEKAIKSHGKEQVIERVAYIWFNRFCALRFMDVNRYTRIGVVSPAEGQFQPEILAEAKMGHIDEEMVHDKVRQQIFALLAGSAPSRDPQGEAYRLLVVAACNFWNKAMPFLFQRIDDYTELLMPDDLLSENSILAHMREAICLPTTAGARDQGTGVSETQANPSPLTPNPSSTSLEVEVIGWLYQFYISEKKDEVFDGLKKNRKITPENIPAATQLFTPHWIVKYLVENSLGRLWMLNRPNSQLVNRMEYYIRPDTSGVREQGLGVREQRLGVREQGLGVREQGLGIGKQGLGVREQGLGARKKIGDNDGSEKLSGSDRLAEGDGLSGDGVSGNQGISQGGALRINQSGSQSGGVNSVQHSRGSRSQLDSGIQELPFDSSGIQSGSGNTNSDRQSTALHISTASAGNTLSTQGNQQNADGSEKQTNPSPLTPTPSTPTREEDFIRITKPEDIKICDPACGSSHMLTYAFDLFYAIYEEEGYEPAEIPEKILIYNLYGIEIDERAGELAAFALSMKARAKQRRFFNKGVKPNICVLENVYFDEGELKEYLLGIRGQGLGVSEGEMVDLLHDLNLFEEADNFGSLLRPTSTTNILEKALSSLSNPSSLTPNPSLFEQATLNKVKVALEQASYLSPKYHVVIANPPYMGSKGMNGRLTTWAKENYQHCWDRGTSDLYAMFIDRAVRMTLQNGASAMITMQGWMFTSSFELLRSTLLANNSLTSVIHLGTRAFDSIAGHVVSTVAFVFQAKNDKGLRGHFFRLTSGENEESKRKLLEENVHANKNGIRYAVHSKIFNKIPGSPISYWISNKQAQNFETFPLISSIADFKAGLSTGDNTRFQRVWHEVDLLDMAFACISTQEIANRKWVPCNSGGTFRKWYGNNEIIIFWKNNGEAIKQFRGSAIRNEDEYFKPGLTYNKISSGKFVCREKEAGFIFDDTGRAIVCDRKRTDTVQALLSSSVAHCYLDILAPTLSFTSKELERIPFCEPQDLNSENVKSLVKFSRLDWDSYENSWDFTCIPLLNPDYHQPTLKATYQKLRVHWQEMTLEMQRLEVENNRIFIEAYDLQEELTPEVPLEEITLTCNPYYRFSAKAVISSGVRDQGLGVRA